MRFTLYILALLGITQLHAQQIVDSTLMDQGTQHPRSEIIAYDRDVDPEEADAPTSKYVTKFTEWRHPSDNQRVFETTLTRPFSWLGRQVFLRVDRVSAPYTLMVNSQVVARVQNSMSPAEFNITDASKEGRNIITFTLDEESAVSSIEGWARPSAPMLGEVYVVTQPMQMIRDIAISSELVGDNIQSKVDLIIKSHTLGERTSTVHYSLHREDDEVVTFGHKNITLSMRGEDTLSFLVTIPKSEGWSAESPNLFTLKVKSQYEGRYLEYHNYKVGFRSIAVNPDTEVISVNGNPVDLYAKSADVNFDPAEIPYFKNQGYNAIRIMAGGMNKEIYDIADRVGIYIITTMSVNSKLSSSSISKGGNPTNDPKWLGAYMQRMECGYHTTQLHPSVIAFSIADTSMNGCNLYEGYLRLKAKGDSRPILYFDAGGEWNSDKLRINLK